MGKNQAHTLSIQGKPAPIWPLIYLLQLFLLAHFNFCSHLCLAKWSFLQIPCHSPPPNSSLESFSVSFFPHPHQGKPTKASRVQFKYCPLHGAFSKANSTLLRTDRGDYRSQRGRVLCQLIAVFPVMLTTVHFTFNRCSRTLK